MGYIVPYILPLMLGRTFDLDKMKIGVDIFPKEVMDNRRFYHHPATSHDYVLVNTPNDKMNLLDVDNSFSLKIKSGVVNAGAAGEFLSDPFYKTNVVEVVIKSTYQSGFEYLPDRATPIPTWKKYGEALGTHYVYSVIYGAEVIASIRFETNSTEIKEKISKSPFPQGVLKLGGEDETYKNFLNSVESTDIQIFSSIPISKLPQDIPSLKKLLDEITNDYKNFNNKTGVPIKMELRPLQEFDSSMTYDRTSLDLTEFHRMFNEMRQIKAEVSDWLKRLSKPLTEEQEQKIGDLYNKVENNLKVFHEVIGSLDISKGPEQLQKAKDAYSTHIKEKKHIFYGGEYYIKYKKLRREIEKEQ